LTVGWDGAPAASLAGNLRIDGGAGMSAGGATLRKLRLTEMQEKMKMSSALARARTSPAGEKNFHGEIILAGGHIIVIETKYDRRSIKISLHG
jgi:hypothetical protein